MTETTDFAPAHRRLIDSVPLPAGADIAGRTLAYELDGVALEGVVVADRAASGPRPTVVIVHDWTGLREYPVARAHMLARLGYTAVAIDVYGVGVRFSDEDQAGASAEAGRYYGDTALLRARVAAGVRAASGEAEVDPDRIVVIGYCFGGSAALEFARTGTPVRGVVSFHGGLIAHDPADVAAIAAPLLVLTGGADPVVPDADIVAFQDELRTRDDIDWQIVVYSGAPHAFTLPGPMRHERADRRSWSAFRDFLAEHLPL